MHQGGNPTGIPPAAIITESDINGEVAFSTTDYHGRPIERMFPFQGMQAGLQQSDYAKLIELARAIQRLPGVRDFLSQRFIEETLFEWLRMKFLGLSSDDFVAYLQAQAESSIVPMTVYIPIANTIVTEPFAFGGTEFLNLSNLIIDDWLSSVEQMPASHQSKARELVEDFRHKHQGRAALRLCVNCENYYAFDMAVDKADAITNLVSIFLGFVHVIDIKSTLWMKGSEHLDSAIALFKKDNQKWMLRQQNLDKASSRPIVIDSSWLDRARTVGMETLSSLYTKPDPSEFEQTILNMAFLYSKAAYTKQPLEKLIYCLSAIEITLLKSESEPIQQNIGERMAMFSWSDLEDRKEVIRNLRAVYTLRSRYLHHGQSGTELKELDTFYMNTWVFFVSLLSSASRFRTKEEFLVFVDDLKYK
jgi:hypothetical protein